MNSGDMTASLCLIYKYCFNEPWAPLRVPGFKKYFFSYLLIIDWCEFPKIAISHEFSFKKTLIVSSSFQGTNWCPWIKNNFQGPICMTFYSLCISLFSLHYSLSYIVVLSSHAMKILRNIFQPIKCFFISNIPCA